MKITVDTKEDAPEDIRKVVALLSSLSGKEKEKHKAAKEREKYNASNSTYKDVFSNPLTDEEQKTNVIDMTDAVQEQTQEEVQPTAAFSNMFGSTEPVKADDDGESEDDPDVEEEKEEPQIMMY